MADLRGRCGNVEFCSVAVGQKMVRLPEGSNFVCPKCGEPLVAAGAAKAQRRSRIALALQVSVVLVGGGIIAYKISGRTPNPSAIAGAIPSLTGASPARAGEAEPAAPAARPPVQVAMATAPSRPVEAASAALLPANVILRLAGSETIGANLAPRLASGYLSLIGNTAIAVAPGNGEGVWDVVGQQANQRDVISVTSNSSAAGFSMLLRGNADIAMSTAKITPAELERLSSLGDLASPGSEMVIGIQGVAVAVAAGNRVSSLTVSQLRAIFSGQVTDWAELGGAPGPVRVFIGEGRGGAAIVPQEIGIGQNGITSTATRIASEQKLVEAVAGTPGGIGLIAFGRTGAAKVLSVAESGAVPILPSDLSIATENYPLTRRLYLYASPNTSNGFVRRLADHAFSPAGQAVIEASGFVPLTVKAEPVAVPDTASDRFRQLTAGATRVSIDFRFQPGGRLLDNKGARDVERLLTFVKAQRINPGRLILAGFADNSGTAAANQAASQQRTEAVVSALTKGGVPPGKALTFGGDLPVADNATPEGRERNRRVEVYLAPG